jgi:hypothetical protein
MGKILFFILFVFGLISSSFAEDITITTYYPSPYGSYNSLQADRIGVGDNNASGSLTSADVPTTSGHMWVRGNVGIGTTNPLSRLSVGGNGNVNYMIYGYSSANNSTGIYGEARQYGIQGYGTSTGTSTGVYGSGRTYGVHGYSSIGRGIYGEGVYGISGSGGIYGVYGSSNTSGNTNYGVYGEGGEYGVYGTGTDYGVYGYSNTSGTNYGVYGQGGEYGVAARGSTAAFRAISGGYQFPDYTIQTTAATASASPACRLCGRPCVAPWSKRVGEFDLGNSQDMDVFAPCNYDQNNPNAEPNKGTVHHVVLCCR